MSYRSTQSLDPKYDDIQCTSIECTTATFTNLTVSGTMNLPDNSNSTMDELTVNDSLVCEGTTNLQGAVTISGAVNINNKTCYVGFNSNGQLPPAPTSANLYGCISGNCQLGSAEVDLINTSSVTSSTLSAFNFYKLPNTTPIVKIQNNGQISATSPPTNDNSNLLATTSWVQTFAGSGADDVSTNTNQTITGQKTFTETVLCTATMPANTDKTTTMATTAWTQNCVANWVTNNNMFPPVVMINQNSNPTTSYYIPIWANIPDMTNAYSSGSTISWSSTSSNYPYVQGINIAQCDDYWILAPYYKLWIYGSTNYANNLWYVQNLSDQPICIKPSQANQAVSVQIAYMGTAPPA